MVTMNGTLAEQVTATQQRTLQLVASLNNIALGLRSNTRRSEKQIDASMLAIAHHAATTLSDEVGRTLAEARTTGPIAERVNGIGNVAAPTAIEWVHEYACRVRKVIVDEFRFDRWWPSEWEHIGGEYEWEIEYAKNNPPAALLLAVREHISPLFRWWRRGAERIKAEVAWEARRAIDHLERRQARSWFAESTHVSFGNWATPQVVSESVCKSPLKTDSTPPTSPPAPAPPPPKRYVTVEEANAMFMEAVAREGAQFIKLSLRQVAKRFKCSPNTVRETEMWKATHTRKQKSRRPRAVPLTPMIEATLDDGREIEMDDLVRESRQDEASDHQPRRKLL